MNFSQHLRKMESHRQLAGRIQPERKRKRIRKVLADPTIGTVHVSLEKTIVYNSDSLKKTSSRELT